MSIEPAESASDLVAPEVQLEDITTIIGEIAVLHRLRLIIPAGEVTVLMGPSGVGKTTLIKHIVGLLEPDGGTVRIGDGDIWQADKEQWRTIRKRMSAMLGGSTLYTTSVFSSLSVLENLTYTLESQDVPLEEHHDRAMARLEEVGLDDVPDRKPDALPAHAWKRLALARALVADAPLTVLDEIDVGLDREHRERMLDAVRRLRERRRCTLLITTHNLELARTLADNLAIMVNGRIVAFGSPEDVLSGVRSTEDFDRKFEFSDYHGPPRLEDAEAAAGRKRGGRKMLELNMDPQMIWLAVAGLILITLLFIALTVTGPGSAQ